MISEEHFFKNHFDDEKIINNRLETFTGDMIGKLTAGNTGDRFQPILDKLAISYPAFTGDVSDVAIALSLQRGTTMTVEGVVRLFKTTMSAQEPFIASALGGRATPAYEQFYNHKISEYSRATQADMITLTTKVNTAATANATALGTTLATLLQGFKTQWSNSKTAQELKKGTVAISREERNDTRTNLELDLCYGINIIASLFPGDVDTCSTFVDFALLTTTPRRKHITRSGTIVVSSKVEAGNKLFGADEDITIENTCTNADIEAYLVENIGDEPTVTVIVKPEKSVKKPATAYGDLSNPILVVRNRSRVNDATYVAKYLE